MTIYTPDSIEQELYFKDMDGGYVSVRYASYPENPFMNYDPLGEFLTWSNRFASPSENPYRSATDFTNALLGEEKAASCKSMQDVLQAFDEAGYAAAGIYRFDHGQVSYSLGQSNPFNDYWDSGPAGFAIVPPEKLEAEGMSKEQALACMDAEMKEYSAWANGDVFVVWSYDERGEVLDSGIFYGIEGVSAEHSGAEPIDLGRFPDLDSYIEHAVLTEELQEGWAFHGKGEWDRDVYVKEPLAIVSDEDGVSWRVVDVGSEQVSFGVFESPQEALSAVKQHEAMSTSELRSFIPPEGLLNKPLNSLMQEARERAAEKNCAQPNHAKDRRPPEMGL